MILVTLGTQDKSFKRLLDAVQQQIDNGNITEEVVVQAGFTTYKSDKMKIIKYIPYNQFYDLVEKADIIITHAGVGSIMAGINKNKKVIAAARLKKYKEHTNDHQLQILGELSKREYIIALEDFLKLGEAIKQAKEFIPNEFESNTDNIIKLVKEYIDNN